MTLEIVLVLGILLLALVLFVGGWIRMDLTALLVLGLLAVTGLVTPAQALSGFSNPAVVTVGAVFILSGGLSRTGVARALGRRVVRVAGRGETRLLLVIMGTAAVLSAFMNNVGVAALLLPVVMDIARSTGRPPGRLLLPLAYATLLGGLTTLIGTPPNILASEALGEAGLRPFGLFDYTPVGGVVLVVGIAFMLVVGRRLLPDREPGREPPGAPPRGPAREPEGGGAAPVPEPGGRGGSVPGTEEDLETLYELREELFVLRVGAGSPLAGRTLAESRLGAALGLNVLGVLRTRGTDLAPDPGVVLEEGDRLLVHGSPERLAALRGGRLLEEAGRLALERLAPRDVEVAEVRLEAGADLVGRTLEEADLRARHGVHVVGVRRGDRIRRTDVQTLPLRAGDRLLVQAPPAGLEALRDREGLRVSGAERAEVYGLEERAFAVRVPEGSTLAGRTLGESRLGDAFGLNVVSIVRDGRTLASPDPAERIRAGDALLVVGRAEELDTIRGLQELEMTPGPPPEGELESERVGLVEAVLAPRSGLVGKTLRQLRFRDRYGLSVLAVLREGRVLRTDLRDLPIRFGDALLVYGPARRLRMLGQEPDFLVLTRGAQPAVRTSRAPVAVGIMAAVLTPVLLGWLPIAVAAVIGAAAMVLAGCLTMDEAYRDVEWRAVFLIAGMLPLGTALEQTGAAGMLAGGVVEGLGRFGPLAVLAGLFALTSLGTQVIPAPAVVVLLSPIVLSAAAGLSVSPYTLMMGVAIAAAAGFASPVTHPANVLVMGPGGYRFRDYLRVGLPLTLVTFLVVLLLTPLVWPFHP